MNDPTAENIIVLNALMMEYKQNAQEIQNACRDIDEQLANLSEIRKALAQPYQDRLNEIEAQMRQPMLDRATSFVCEYGKIGYRKGAVRRSYNIESLDMLCNAEPEVKKLIWPFRSETVVEPSISIKVVESWLSYSPQKK